MTKLRDSINKLIEKTLTMEKNQEQTQEEIINSLMEEEILDLTHPMYQTQTFSNEDEEDKEEKNDFQESSTHLPQKSQDFSPPDTE